VVGPNDPTKSVLDHTQAAGSDPNAPVPEPPPPEIPGFKLLTKLGQGGQGSVWLAEQLDGFGKRCALKIFAREQAASYTRELEAWKRVEEIRRGTGTPHLVEGYAADVTRQGVAFVAMAFFERGSLSDRLVADGPLPSSVAVRYMRHVLAALDLLHQHGLWHRDVKPQNILLGNDGIARLADYGLSKRLGATVTASCTPAFAAPEQLAGEEDADGVRIDIYGVAASLFALVTGKPPVPGRPDVFLLERRKVPRPIHAPLLRALNPDPAQRYSRAAEFAHALAMAEPSSSGAGFAADVVNAVPTGERTIHEALSAETRAADPDRPLAVTPPLPLRAPKESSAVARATTRGRRARRARAALLAAGGLFVLALVLDALSGQGGTLADPHKTDGAVPTTESVDRPTRTPIAVSEERNPIPLARVRGLGAGTGAVALTGSGTVWLAAPGKTLALPIDARRAVPWTRDRILALQGSDLALVGELGAYPIPGSEVVALAGHAPSGTIAFGDARGELHVFKLDDQDQVVPGSRFKLPTQGRSIVTSVALDAEGSLLACASISDPDGEGRIAIYSLGRAQVPRLETVLEHPGPVAVAWLDARSLAVADMEGALSVLDARDGSIRRSLPCFEGTIVSLARSADGEKLLVLGDDRTIESADAPGTVTLGEPGESLGSLARVARKRLLGFRVDELLGRGEVKTVLDATSFK
jgi:hypothetical protein